MISWKKDTCMTYLFARTVLKNTLFNDWSLICQARLSTMDLPENVIVWLKEKKVL